MAAYMMTETERLLAEVIWDAEPLGSGELVKLASQRLGWKKATTYTMLRKLCKNGIFQNKGAVVTSKISKEAYTTPQQKEKEKAFPKRKKYRENDIKERVNLVGESQNETVQDGKQSEQQKETD